MTSKLHSTPMVIAMHEAPGPALAALPERAAKTPRPLTTAPGPRALDDAVARAQAGDVAAFEQVYRTCIGRVFALCLRLSRERSEAERLAQDVFVHAWEKLDRYRGEAAFTTWLHRLAVNRVLEDRRRDGRRRERERVQGERRPTSERPHAALEVGVDLERAIADLPERARTVLVLHDVEGLAHDEIAAAMHTSVGTCKAQLHRARKMLREALR